MTGFARLLRLDPAEVEPWAETCGQIRPLIEEADGDAAEVHHVEIRDAELHYDEKTDEIYPSSTARGRWSSTTRRSSSTKAWSSTSPRASSTRRSAG